VSVCDLSSQSIGVWSNYRFLGRLILTWEHKEKEIKFPSQKIGIQNTSLPIL
jgi:hypothetical protein